MGQEVFPASGQLTCTRSLAAAQHKEGLIFYDSPGIGDELQQENITRVALGVKQLEKERVNTIRLLDITETNQEGPGDFKKLSYKDYADEIKDSFINGSKRNISGKEFQLDRFQEWQSQYPFDFAVFLTSSERGLPVADSELITEFYHIHQTSNIKMFKVFNVFHNRYKSNTEELDSEVMNKFSQAKDRLKKAGLKDYDQWITIDSKNGCGLEAFVKGFADCLPVEVLKSLSQVLKEEHIHLIQDKIDQYYFDYLAYIASLIAVFPVDHSEGRIKLLKLSLESLTIVAEFMSPDKNAQEARPLVNQVINQITMKSTRATYEFTKKFRWRWFLKFQDFFDLYTLEKSKVGEYSGVGGIHSIRRILPLGLVINQLFRGHSANELEALSKDNTKKIDPLVDKLSGEINRIIRVAGRQSGKDRRIELSEELYPHIRQLLTEYFGLRGKSIRKVRKPQRSGRQ